ncbi:MAG: hypothetical protein H7255_01060 [Ramlibacter sp.]|nr:hypothetical protein [Ramlibacter sp.]
MPPAPRAEEVGMKLLSPLLSSLVALTLASPAMAESPTPPTASDVANQGIAADIGTTALGLSMGAAEANPLGLLVLPLKFLVKAQIEKIADENERRDGMAMFTGVQFGAAAANICTLALANPAIAIACMAGGAIYGYNKVKSIPTQGECLATHRAKMEDAAATGRIYRVSLKDCKGSFAEPTWAQVPADAVLVGDSGGK